MRTIAASEGAYDKVMDKKSEMEKRKGARRVVPMADALDELLMERTSKVKAGDAKK